MTNPYGNFGYTCVTANALRSPERIAITYCGGEQITFDGLNRRVNRMAHALLEAGVRPGDRVASLLQDSLNVTDVYLAESKLGVTIAALNLVLDFDFIESGAEAGAPKYMEWYAAFGLMVTLVWLYLEILRLLSKLRD